MSGYIVTWNDASSSAVAPDLYVQRVRRGMFGGVRGIRLPIPGRDGGYYFSERRGTRRISADCTVVGDSPGDRRVDVVAIANWLDKLGEGELKFSDQDDRYWLATLVSDPDPDEWRLLGRFTIEWEAQPYAFSTSISTEVITTSAAASGVGGGGDDGSFTVPDEIDAYPEVTIVPSGGNVTSVSWTLNNDLLEWSGGPVLAGESLVISSLSDTITVGLSTDVNLTGAFDPGQLSVEDADGAFGLVVPGINNWDIDWEGTATSLTVTVRWRRRYR